MNKIDLLKELLDETEGEQILQSDLTSIVIDYKLRVFLVLKPQMLLRLFNDSGELLIERFLPVNKEFDRFSVCANQSLAFYYLEKRLVQFWNLN